MNTLLERRVIRRINHQTISQVARIKISQVIRTKVSLADRTKANHKARIKIKIIRITREVMADRSSREALQMYHRTRAPQRARAVRSRMGQSPATTAINQVT